MSRRLGTYLEFAQQFEKIESGLLVAPPEQVRRDLGDLSELCASIKLHGLLQPILVRPKGNQFEVVCGNRRFAACKRLMRRHIECIVKDLSDRDAFEVSLVENVQRRTLNPIEEARAYQRYVSEYGWGGASDLAAKIGKSQVYVSHRMALLSLPEKVQAKIEDGTVTPSQGQELAWFKEPPERDLVFSMLDDQKLTVKRIRRLRKKLEGELEDRVQIADLAQAGATDFMPIFSEEKDVDQKHVEEAILALRIAYVKMGAAMDGLESHDVKLQMTKERAALNEMIDRLIRAHRQLRPGR